MNQETEIVRFSAEGTRCELSSPVALPDATAFLWNRQMLLQVNCRGYATARYMQPDAAQYSRPPVLEQETFIQPEQPYYAHHPGRFAYVRDEDSLELYSAPFAPVLRMPERFLFSAGQSDVRWLSTFGRLDVTLSVSLPLDHVVELWEYTIANTEDTERRVSLYPVFTVGYMSWMNQSAAHVPELGALIASCVTPYQKLEDYERIRELKDRTFLAYSETPDAWENSVRQFEGTTGIHAPEALGRPSLGNGDAVYETPLAALQYRLRLAPGEKRTFRFAFGPAKDATEIREIRDRYLAPEGADDLLRGRQAFVRAGKGCLTVESPDRHFDHFVNHWLNRQVYYHGTANRLTADPQTRNFLQDHMGMTYVDSGSARSNLLRALSQQAVDGSLPDGILLDPAVHLKYINQIPHTDHCVWLPIALEAWLDETGDYGLLDEAVPGAGGASAAVADRVDRAMDWLLTNRDSRGLSLIAQGDWCDPMNMVGHKGRGISGWLTIATTHAVKTWARICDYAGRDNAAARFRTAAAGTAEAIERYLWDGKWYLRGITDDGTPFGTESDAEGRIFLNPQSWALLAGIVDTERGSKLIEAVSAHLQTPFGTALLDPPFTSMREDIGRVTQKHPGTAENGAIYNHACAFWINALYRFGEADHAFRELMRAIPGPEAADYVARGQLPVFVPNYYRGAGNRFPRTAGRSSQLFNTGAAGWLYRTIIEELFGLRGCRGGLRIEPELPSHWQSARVRREFRGAHFDISFERGNGRRGAQVSCNGEILDAPIVRDVTPGERYAIEVLLPIGSPSETPARGRRAPVTA